MVRTRLFGLRLRDWSHAQEPWMGEYDPVLRKKLVLCNHSLHYFWETCRFLCLPVSFDSVQWWPHSSILDPGWDETPGSCGPVVGLCGASLVSRSPALQFQDLRVFLKYHSGQGTPPFEEGACRAGATGGREGASPPHSDYSAPSVKMSVKIDFIYEI